MLSIRGSLVIMGAGLILTGSALAVPSKTEIRSKSRDLSRVQEELQQKKQEQERLKKEAGEISKSLEVGESKIQGIETSLLHIKEKNVEVEETLAQSKNHRDEISKRITDTHTAVRRAFGNHYVFAGLTDPIFPSAVLTRVLYRQNLNKINNLSRQKDEAEQSFNDLTSTYQVLQKQVQNQQQTLHQIRLGLASQELLLKKKLTRKQAVEEEVKDLNKTAEELASLIDLLRSKAKEEAVQQKKERQEKISTGRSPILRHSLPWPVSGAVVEKFGRRQHPEATSRYISNGLTLQPAQKSAVAVVSDGTVLYAGNFMSYGPMVLVEHSGDWYTVYGQLSAWSVEKGQSLKQGDSVGESGYADSGKSAVYFELRFYGKPVDPLLWLRESN